MIVDPIEAFNLLLERIDCLTTAFERIATAHERIADKVENKPAPQKEGRSA